jgi:hypothetical protein
MRRVNKVVRVTIVPMKNGLAADVRQASDFLMALSLNCGPLAANG